MENKKDNFTKDDEIEAKKDKIDKFKSAKIQIYFNIVGITLGTLLIFLVIGYIIDTIFHISPYGKIGGAVLAFPVIQFLVYKRAKQLTKYE